MDGLTLTAALHQRGLNVRYLGTLLMELERVEEKGRLRHIQVVTAVTHDHCVVFVFGGFPLELCSFFAEDFAQRDHCQKCQAHFSDLSPGKRCRHNQDKPRLRAECKFYGTICPTGCGTCSPLCCRQSFPKLPPQLLSLLPRLKLGRTVISTQEPPPPEPQESSGFAEGQHVD